MSDLNESISSLRGRQTGDGLSESGAAIDPVRQFEVWMAEALESDIELPTAMVLATVSVAGVPSARMVLLKALEDGGFVFYTNYSSRKARELDANPNAALVFYWEVLHRQVRVEGAVEKLPASTSDEYWSTRPLASRLGAYVSRQSEVIEGREDLERRFSEARSTLGEAVPRPDFWGGYVLRAETVEFWQGRPDRLHDRLVYSREGGSWTLRRLSP